VFFVVPGSRRTVRPCQSTCRHSSGRISLASLQPVRYANVTTGCREVGSFALTAANCCGSKNPRRTLSSRSIGICGLPCSLPACTAKVNIRLRQANSRLISPGLAFASSRAVTNARITGVVMENRRFPLKAGFRCLPKAPIARAIRWVNDGRHEGAHESCHHRHRREERERDHPHLILFLRHAKSSGSLSAYGFLQGAWPFGVVEAIWGVVAVNRWRAARTPAKHH
jgi:hypothetical protein